MVSLWHRLRVALPVGMRSVARAVALEVPEYSGVAVGLAREAREPGAPLLDTIRLTREPPGQVPEEATAGAPAVPEASGDPVGLPGMAAAGAVDSEVAPAATISLRPEVRAPSQGRAAVALSAGWGLMGVGLGVLHW